MSTLETVFANIDQRLVDAKQPLIVTLSGPSGSGKSTILKKFQTHFPDMVSVLETDSFYIGKTRMANEMPAGEETNFDHPASVDTGKIVRIIKALRSGHEVDLPVYSMMRSEPENDTIKQVPTPLIVVEGLMANLPEIRRCADFSLALNVPLEVRLSRRVQRDVTRNGSSAEKTTRWMLNEVEPSYQRYYAEADKAADYQISNPDV